MGSYMYKHRPNYAALAGALMTFVAGVLIYFMQFQSSGGHMDPRWALLIPAVTLVLTAALLLVAFARYRYTHLWSKKHRGKHDRSVHKKHRPHPRH